MKIWMAAPVPERETLFEDSSCGGRSSLQPFNVVEAIMYNIEYHRSDGRVFHYLGSNTDEATAKVMLKRFKQRYFTVLGKPRAYPNGQGHYDIINPRIVRVN